jgi:putative membrane protein
MRRDLIAVAVGLSAPFLLDPTAFAAQAPTTEDFVKTVAISDMFEIQAGQLAADKAQNGDVKSFGQEMVDDHSKTSDDLKELIKDATVDKLKDLSGNQFDKTYVQTQVKAHEQAVSLFEAYAAAGENDALKDWAEDTLPKLKEHLKEANDLNVKVDQVVEVNDKKKSGDRPAGDNAAANEDAAAKPVQKSNIKYITRQAPSDWTAEALIGRKTPTATISARSIM